MRSDLAAAQDEAWRRLGLRGTWWTGAERIAIARECREATECAFCATRVGTLSPWTLAARHPVADPTLPAPAIEAIHRIRTDPGRLGEAWFQQLRDAGLAEGAYVELVSV